MEQLIDEITMTEEAQKILQRMNKSKALKRGREFSNSGRRDRVLNEFNRDQLDDVGPIGGAERGIKVLSEMNSLADEHNEFVKSSTPGWMFRN